MLDGVCIRFTLTSRALISPGANDLLDPHRQIDEQIAKMNQNRVVCESYSDSHEICDVTLAYTASETELLLRVLVAYSSLLGCLHN